MPPRASAAASGAQSTFGLPDANHEVVCPLRNQDGSNCRKRCLGEKRFRSMQEHIRRAHPEYYIPKLPATKESFELMISTPPHEVRPAENPNSNSAHQQHPQQPQHSHQHSDPSGLSPSFNLDAGLGSSYEGYHALGGHDGGYYTANDTDAAQIFNNMQFQQQRSSDEYRRGSLIPAASAAAALAQLHSHRGGDAEWGAGADTMGQVIFPSLQMSPTVTEADLLQTYYGDANDIKANPFHVDPQLEDSSYLHDQSQFPSTSQDTPGLMPSSLARSPPDRSTTLPPLQRSLSRSGGYHNRPRKSSLTQQARVSKHERKRSKDYLKRSSGERKALSAEPGSQPAFFYGKRWEDLIDAAASATEEEGSRDLTPIPASPYLSPQGTSRTSLPPPFGGVGAQFHNSFQASPLNRALTPPSAHETGLEHHLQTFPSVDSSLSSNLSHQHHNSADSGSQFQIMNPSSIDTESSPVFTSAAGGGGLSGGSSPVQIYCTGCRRLCILKEAFACTGCISGLCGPCINALIQEQSRGRMSMCPHCHAMDSSYKPFRLEFR